MSIKRENFQLPLDAKLVLNFKRGLFIQKKIDSVYKSPKDEKI
tara:strand:+ start:700 stop:828 length:129 start_codon:yes stop_codon:yes gene_type:complete